MAGKKQDDGPAKGGGPLGLVLPAVLAGAVALGVSYLDPFSGGEEHAPEAAATGAEAWSGDDLWVLEPMIVSLAAPEGEAARAFRLRLSVALRAPGGPDETQALPLRDALTSAARSVPPGVLTGPDGLAQLRAALMAAAQDTLGEGAVTGVLITDFVIV